MNGYFYFVSHGPDNQGFPPRAVAAFGRECARRSPPPTVSIFGSQLITCRGLPIVPCDKLLVDSESSPISLQNTTATSCGFCGLTRTFTIAPGWNWGMLICGTTASVCT